MMKFMLVMISLLLLSILNDHQAHGIRLIERSDQASKDQPKSIVHEEESNRVGIRAEPEKEKDGAESSGSKRILMTKNSTPSTTTTSKNGVEKGKSSSERSVVGGEEENLAVNSSPVPGQHHSLPATTIKVPGDDQYPDIIDIAEMDYSPAKRKPPIHN